MSSKSSGVVKLVGTRPRATGRLPVSRGERGQFHGLRRLAALVLLRLRTRRRRARLHPDDWMVSTCPRRFVGCKSGSWEPVRAATVAPVSTINSTERSRSTRDRQLLTAAMRVLRGAVEPVAVRQLDYLASRGIDFDVGTGDLALGYVDWTPVCVSTCNALGFDDARLQSSGLFTERRRALHEDDRLSPKSSPPAPCSDTGDSVHWLAGRSIQPVTPGSDSPLLPGPKPVLGLGRLSCPSATLIVVTEGLFDWLTLASWDIPAVAALGTQGLEKAVAALRGQPRIFLAFDSDDAGQTAADRLRESAWRASLADRPTAPGRLGRRRPRNAPRRTRSLPRFAEANRSPFTEATIYPAPINERRVTGPKPDRVL